MNHGAVSILSPATEWRSDAAGASLGGSYRGLPCGEASGFPAASPREMRSGAGRRPRFAWSVNIPRPGEDVDARTGHDAACAKPDAWAAESYGTRTF